MADLRPADAATAASETRSTWIIGFVLLCVIASDRAFVVVASGGQGLLPLLAVVAPLGALVALWRFGTRRSLGFVGHPAFVVGLLPYLVLTAVLPFLGVMFHAYPERTLLSVTDATTAVSFLILGAAASSSARAGWAKWLLPAILVEVTYAAAQTINWSRGPGWELFTPLAEWDRGLAVLEGQLGSAGRSTGLFTNPNELGLWAAVAAVLAWTLLGGRRRVVAVALAMMTLLLSQARGPGVGLLAAVIAGATLGIARGRLATPGSLRAGVTILSAVVIVMFAIASQVVDVSLDRFAVLVQVLIEGPQADVNLAGRLNLWYGVLVLNLAYPLGTWGSPELLLGAAVDSAWFRAFAQGSAIYVTAFAILIGAALAVRSPALGDALRLTCVVIAVTGITQTSLSSPVTPIFWVLLGIYLQSSLEARRSRRSERVWSPGMRANPAGLLAHEPAHAGHGREFAK